MTIGWKARVVDPGIASYRYRVLVPIEGLRARGHDVGQFDPARGSDYSTVIFSKTYSAEDQKLAAGLRAQGTRIVFDICDNHFYNPFGLPKYEQVRGNLLAMIGLCDDVVCSTDPLADIVVSEAGLGSRPKVIGDVYERIARDMNLLPPEIDDPYLLWFGQHGSPNAPSGMTDLLLVQDRLAAAHARNPFTLVVMSNNRDKFERELAQFPVPTRYVDWTHSDQQRFILFARAVLIPLSDNPFVACKTHNRLSMVLAAGVPAVADSIRSYREFAPFAYLDDWDNGLHAVLTAPEEARTRAAGARAYCEEKWSEGPVVDLWEAVLGLKPTHMPVSHDASRLSAKTIALARGEVLAGRFVLAEALLQGREEIGGVQEILALIADGKKSKYFGSSGG